MVAEILERLMEGNRRFVENKLQHPNISNEIRQHLSERQNPFAAIVSCSDSRVPVELIFDLGIGDVFVVRSAGHVLTEAGVASLEYAVKSLGVSLILVLGHTNCGAIKTAIKGAAAAPTKSIATMIKRVEPAIKRAKKESHSDGELNDLSTKYNVIETIEYIESHDDLLKHAVDEGKIVIAGAIYDVASGKVELIQS